MRDGGRLDLRATLRLTVRNLARNPRRTGLTLASLVVGIAALTFLSALNQGWLVEMQNNFILDRIGHVQVHAAGFEASQSIADHIPDPAMVVAAVERDPEVAAATVRLRVSGLAAVGEHSAGTQVLGIDPDAEPHVTRMDRCLTEGRWISADAPRGLLLGKTLAENLGARLGDRVVLTAQRPDGQMASEAFRLRGVLCGASVQVERMAGVLPLQSAQYWLGLAGGVTDVVLRAASHDAAPRIKKRLEETLPAGAFEVMTWEELDPMVQQWLRFSGAYSLVIILVVVALVVAGVLNTMLMALHERVPEIGLMAALGLRRGQLFRMLLLEGVLLVAAGAFLGFCLGVLAVARYADAGIDLSAFSAAFQFFYMSPIIRPMPNVSTAVLILGTTLAAATLAGLYPAWKATRLDPVRALRRM